MTLELTRARSRLRRLADSKLVAGLLLLLGLYLTVACAYGVYDRWHQGSFRLVASILGVVLFGGSVYFQAHYIVTGRRHFANLS